MMKYQCVKDLTDDLFHHLSGLKRETFHKVTRLLKEDWRWKHGKGGRNSKLCIEDMLLMSLEYLREYRTYFHISQSYGISESTAYKVVRWVEDTLIKYPDFALPGRKALLRSDVEYKVVLIDATETPIERPQKNKNISTLGRSVTR